MAAYTSTQSGNFNASATWGGSGYPSANGDTFTVTAGHTVTYNISSPLSDGFGDSNVYGTLTHATGTTQIRMNGRLYIQDNGRYDMNAGSTHWINGSQADQHGIWIENKTNASMTAVGSEAMPTTTTSSAITTLGATSIPVSSSTNFVAGEWIAIYRNEPSSHTQDNDEGVIIHEVSGNTIYFRHFVSPTATVSRYNGTALIVDNAKVFRVGQKIIVGTGSNRNIKTISRINYRRNRIVCDSSFSGSIAGETVYLTGLNCIHDSGEIVRKNATYITTAASSGSSIVVANAANFDVNDVIVMEHGYDATGSSSWSNGKQKHTITAKSGNTLTISPDLTAPVGVGDFVTVFSRDCCIKSDPGDFGFLYKEYYTSNWNSVIHFKNTEFSEVGNSGSSLYRGVVLRGYMKTDFRSNGPVIEGCSISSDTYRGSRSSLWLYSSVNYALIRNNVVWSSNDGINPYYCHAVSLLNNFILHCSYTNIRDEGSNGYNYRIAYNRGHRADDYGAWAGHSCYEQGEGFFQNSFNSGNQYPMRFTYSSNHEIFQNEWINFRYSPYQDWVSNGKMIYNKFTTYDTGLEGMGRPIGSSYAAPYRSGSEFGFFESYEHNFMYDEIMQGTHQMLRWWDNAEKAWRVIRRNDSDTEAGFTSTVYVPAGSTITARFTVKLVSNWSGTQPYGLLRSVTGSNNISTSKYGTTNPNYNMPVRVSTQASFTTSGYSSLTVSATNNSGRGTFVMAALMSGNRNASEGWYQKPDEILIHPNYRNIAVRNARGVVDSHSSVQPGASFTNNKTVLGGVTL